MNQKTSHHEPTVYTMDQYKVLCQKVTDRIESLSAIKGAEYTGGNADRLDNFRRNGKKLEVPMETVWNIYVTKHLDSIDTYVKDIQKGIERERSEPMSGRALDVIVYMILFLAMLEEKGDVL